MRWPFYRHRPVRWFITGYRRGWWRRERYKPYKPSRAQTRLRKAREKAISDLDMAAKLGARLLNEEPTRQQLDNTLWDCMRHIGAPEKRKRPPRV